MATPLPKLPNYRGIPRKGAVLANDVHVPGWLQIDKDDDYDIFTDAEMAAHALSPLVLAYLEEADVFAPLDSRLAIAWGAHYGVRILIPDPRKHKTLEDALRAAERHNAKNVSALFEEPE